MSMSAQSRLPDELVTNTEAAKILGVEPETLAQWRYLRKFAESLPYFKVGRKVFYSKRDLFAFLETCRVGGAAMGSEQ
ncbi:helix-turn-helix domain-containing protein [Paraburkholderia sp. MM6662-R1]|uniref:helix-turn-helix domain-containing protein n=1 Tax=Paraburkholderia sp. MM6662-R1 TaxID=2991066 RepID=UPI003D1C9CB2